MELFKYWRILRKRWWLILLLGLVGAGSAAYYTAQQPPIYRSSTTLLLSPAANKDGVAWWSATDLTKQMAQTYSHYLQTRMFASLVIEREQLALTPTELIDSVSTQVVEGTQFFEVTAVHNDAAKAQQLATAIANHFIRETLTQQREAIAARRSARDVDNIQSVLAEKLERERQYYEQQVAELRASVQSITQNQPKSATRDELLTQVQTQLSDYEERLVQIMNDQIALQPAVDEQQLNAVTIVEPAALPTRPENQQGVQNVAYALVAALLLGVGLAFGLEYFDYTVNSPEELEELVGQSALGVLGVIGANSHPEDKGTTNNPWQERVDEGVVVLTKPRAPIAEAVRALRTNLQFSGAGRQLRSLVVTSAGPSEGKSTVAANLAVAFAHAGKRVLLVDADLRRPAQHRLFKIAQKPGLSNLLIAEQATDPAVIAQYVQPGPIEALQILPAGPLPPNPAELLSASWSTAIYDALAAQVDLVIWDTPPILTVTDAAILAAHADATLPVVRAGVTRRDLIIKMRESLQRVGANVLAPVLNQVQAHSVGYYQHYYYHYGYQEREAAAATSEKSAQPAGATQRRSAPLESDYIAVNAQPQPEMSHSNNGHTAPAPPSGRTSNPFRRPR